MKVVFLKKFQKDLLKIRDQTTLNRIRAKIEEVEEWVLQHTEEQSIPEIPGMEKLRGYEHHYRIRIGDYRLGISIEIAINEQEGLFQFVRCLHRKDIYKYFP